MRSMPPSDLPLQRREFISAVAGTCLIAHGPAFASTAAPDAVPQPRRVTRLETGWKFSLGHSADVERDFGFGRDQRTFAKAGAGTADAAMAKFDDSAWQSVWVPHDWAVALPFAEPKSPPPKDRADAMAAHGFKAIGRDFPQNSIGWYRVTLPVGPADKSQSIWLEFDGVFRDCIVFVNGYAAGGSESGYAPFRVDIADFLDYDGGPNVLTVRVDASLGEGWFYEGAGIYRHVVLVRTAPVHIPQWGTFVRTELGTGRAQLLVTTDVVNNGGVPVEVVLRQQMFDSRKRIVAECEDARFTLAPGQRSAQDGSTFVDAPSLWSVGNPNLYTMVSEVIVGGQVVDRVETRFGIRSIRFDAERGFFLNGKPVKLLGTCNHHDHAGVGTAIPDALHAWRVAQLKEMGSNAWRSTHNPASQVLLDACDAMGMLMIAEARQNSTSDEALGEIERMVLSSRNHPCVILWSLGNEEPHQATERGARINAEMAERVKRLDPTRQTTFAMDQGWDAGVGRVVDVLGFNYRTDKIEAYHGRHPEQPVYGSETGSTVATRGEYATDPARHIVRAYDTEHPWWASTAEEWWTIVAERPYIAGGFVWTGFDYRGEPTPYAAFPSVSSQFGILDTCGFPKDNYYYYRAWWRPDQPLVHLLPHWNWAGREGQPIEVWTHGNAEEVELRLNGRSLGRKAMPRNQHLEWRVPYAPGRLQAIGYNGSRAVARYVRETSGPAHAVKLKVDRRMAKAGDVVIVNAEVVDSRGRPMPTADNLLRFEVGNGEVIGVGNGNPNSVEPDLATERRAFNGLAQAIVRLDRPGPIDLAVSSAGLAGSRLRIVAL
jgi:beta-galactosidase